MDVNHCCPAPHFSSLQIRAGNIETQRLEHGEHQFPKHWPTLSKLYAHQWKQRSGRALNNHVDET